MNEKADILEQNLITSIGMKTNPFPGLRPFGIEESHLFFGREGQSEEVLMKLSKNRFVAIIGASGTGKSSLIYCGLIPILYGGFITKAGSKWHIITARPGSSPIDNLAESICKSYVTSEISGKQSLKKPLVGAMLRRSSLGLIEALKQANSEGNENILLLIDQFEELFRYRMNRKGLETINEAGAFVKLLVEAVNQTEKPVYIVLTMRSDYIGECAQFQELTSLINLSNYLIPQMTRNDFRDAITGPVAVSGAKIDTMLVQELLNDVGDNPDQLPILQHAMMRAWEYWLNNNDHEKPISIGDYEAIGKMEKALSEHANEAYDELNEEGKRICEVMFKTITEKGSDNRGVRRPTRLEDIANIALTNVDEVIKVIDKFRIAGRSFITPSHEIKLTGDSIIDLSHESLMRIWNRLKVWVDEESSAVQMYLRLSDASAMFQEGETGLWRPPDLQLALNWESKQKPSLAWAQRHNPAFERVIVFLHTSAKEYEAEELNKIKLQKRALQRSRMISAILGIAAVISLGIMIYAQMQSAEAIKQTGIANKKTVEANTQRILAEKNYKEATEQRKIAVEKTSEAIKQSKIAEQQKEIALTNLQEASKQRNIAEKKSIEANDERLKAIKSEEEAVKQKNAAEIAREEAYNRRMRSVAQSMAIKSTQIDNDKDLKALLAYQAYSFNKKYSGIEHDPDIYSGLYSAMITQNGQTYNIYKGHTDAVNSLVFSPSVNVFYSSGSDGKVFRWDCSDSLKKPELIIKNIYVNKVIDISPNAKWLAVGTLGAGLGILDLQDKGSEPRYFPNLGKKIESLAFTRDGNAIIACSGNNLLEFNISSGAGIVTGSTDTTILCISVSPDGKYVAASTRNGKVVLWKRANGFSPEVLLDDPKNQVTSVAFDNSGNFLAIGDFSGYLKSWDMKEKKIISSVRGHTARITNIKYSPDNKLIATSSYDNSILLWDNSNLNAQPVKLKEHDSWVFALAFNSSGDKIVTGSSKEYRLILWPIKTNDMASMVVKNIGRNFSKDEWNTYVGSDINYEKIK
jgi:hypothetical protein